MVLKLLPDGDDFAERADAALREAEDISAHEIRHMIEDSDPWPAGGACHGVAL